MIFKKASRLLQESLKQLAVAGNLRPYHIMGSPGSKNRLEALHLLFIGCNIAEKCFYVLVDGAKRAHSHLHIKSNMFANISLAILNSSITTEKTPP